MKRIEKLGDEADLCELRGLCAEAERLVKSTQDQPAHLAKRSGGPCEDQRKDLLLKIIRLETALALALSTLEHFDRDPALTALDHAISEMLDAEEALHRCR